MAHEIYEQFCVYSLSHGGIPWHNIGTGLETVCADDVRTIAGFNRTIGSLPIGLAAATVPAHMSATLNESIEGYRATVDLSNGRVMGVVTDRYSLLQPEELLAAAEFLVNEFGAKYSLAAQLKEGRREIISLALPDSAGEVAPGDTVKSYFNLANGHDGKLAVCVGSSDIRVVCQNTLSAWLSEGAVQIRHRGGVEKALAHAVMAFTMETKTRRDFYTAMSQRVMSPEAVIAYFDRCLGEVAKPSSQGAKKGRKSLRMRLEALLSEGAIIDVNCRYAMPTNLWGAFNAVTQVATHETYTKDPLDSLYFGSGGKLLSVAQAEAVNLLAA